MTEQKPNRPRRGIADLMQAEEALRRSENRFRVLAENIVDVIWTSDLNLRYTYISPSVTKLNGWSVKEAMAQTMAETMAPSSLELAKRVLMEELAQERQGDLPHRVHTLELELNCKDGSTVWAEVRLTFLYTDKGEPTGIMGVTRDIAERRRADEVLREGEERFRALSAAAQDAIIMMDNDERVTFWNEAAERIFGHARKDVLGKNVHSLLAPSAYRDKFAEAFPRWQDTGQGAAVGKVFELAALRRDGTEFPIEISLSSTQIKGRWNAIAIIHDITERRRAEEEVCQANEKLSALVRKLEERSLQNSLLSEMREFLMGCSTTGEIGPIIVRYMKSLFPGSQGALFLLSASRTDLETTVRWGDFPEDADDNVFAPDACWGLRRGGVYLVDDIETGLLCPHLKHRPATGYACLPLMAKGDVLGLLHVQKQAAGKEADELRLVSELLSLSISNIRLRETLSLQSIKDPLTGLFNRRYMEENFLREINRAARKQERIGVLMVDIDHFKTYNDLHGHPAGDVVLVELANFFKSRVRGADIVCRYGGEEFTMILPECTLENADKRAHELVDEVKTLIVQHNGRVFGPIALSIGVAVYPEHGQNPEDLLRAADTALYRAKQEGRDRVILA